MKNINLLLSGFMIATLFISACNGNVNHPPVPTLGAQIDRMGRPAVNTALNKTFETDVNVKNAAKDLYNTVNTTDAAANAQFIPEFKANLAIYDSLDRVCGNQILASATLDANRYLTLATILADDRLYLNTAATTCTQYLAVEANAAGIVANSDCGGRSLGFDVIDTTYSVLAIGALSGVGDGVVASDVAANPSPTFPYVR
jgi:hypothetical protein